MLYARLPTEEEAAKAGLTASDYEEETEVWPENWPAVQLLLQMSTQWKSGFSGRTGLDYQPLFLLMDRHGLEGDDWWSMFADLQAMEAAALAAMHKAP